MLLPPRHCRLDVCHFGSRFITEYLPKWRGWIIKPYYSNMVFREDWMHYFSSIFYHCRKFQILLYPQHASNMTTKRYI